MQVAGLFLNPRAARHPCWLLDALFRCTAASLLELAAGPHRVRATPAFGLLLNGPGFGEGSDMGRVSNPSFRVRRRLARSCSKWLSRLHHAIIR